MGARVGSLLAGGLALGSLALTGCYEHHTADEALLDIPYPDEAFPADAGLHTDAATKPSGCTGTDPIAQLFCAFTGGGAAATGTGTGTGTGAATTTPDLNTLIALLGGLGGTGTGTGTGTNTTDPIAALLAAFGGGTTGTATGTDPLTTFLNGLGGGTGTGATTTPRVRDAGAAGTTITMPTAEECKTSTDPLTQLICAMQARQNPTTTKDASVPVIAQ